MDSINFSELDDSDFSDLKEKFSSETRFCALLDYVLQLRQSHREEMKDLNAILVSVVADNDPQKNGLFHCGKYLYEEQVSQEEKEKGLKMIERAAACRHVQALEYLAEINITQKNWKRVTDIIQSLFAVQDDIKGKYRTLELLINCHGNVGGIWCKKYFDLIINSGYLRDNEISSDDKIILVSMYVHYCGKDMSIIAHNLPDDDPFFTFIGPFFDSLPAASEDLDVQYFIGYNLIHGISCEENVTKGLQIMCALQKKGIKRDTMSILSKNSMNIQIESFADYMVDEWLFIACLIGNRYSGKSCLCKRISDDKFETGAFICGDCLYRMEMSGKKVKIMFRDQVGCGSYEKSTRFNLKGVKKYVPVCVAILYDPGGVTGYNLEYWYNMVKEENPLTSIFVVETMCDLERDESAKKRISDAKEFCREKNLLYLETSAKEGTGIDKFIHTVCNLSFVPWMKLNLDLQVARHEL